MGEQEKQTDFRQASFSCPTFEIKGVFQMAKIFKLMKYKWLDFRSYRKLRKQGIKPFKEFGLTLFTGRQGSGKTMSMVFEAEKFREKYKNLYICSNFGYVHETEPLKSLSDIAGALLKAKDLNCEGVLILWDEIQNDFDSFSKVSRDVLATVTQQRKQHIKILGTSQVFTRVSKALREQTYEVAICRTYLGRLTYSRFYDAEDFIHNIEKPEEKRKMFPKRKISFVQSDELREVYDSFAVIRTLRDRSTEEKSNPSPNIYIAN